MDCIITSSSSAFFYSLASRVSVVSGRPSSATSSLVQLWSHGSQSPGRSVNSRSSHFCRSLSSAPKIVCSSSSPLQTEDLRTSSADSRDEASSSQNLSAKERRKLRNERRQEAKASQEPPWKEMVQDRLLQKRKKIRGWQEDADINRCISKGVQWWMIQTSKKFESHVAEQISIIFPETFPEKEFEVLVPTVPVKLKLKDGSVSLARKKLYVGIVLLRCVLDRDVCFMVKKIPHAYEFFGNLAGLSLQPIIMPAPVSNFNMDNMFQKIRKEEEEYEEFKEQCKKEVEEERKEKQRKVEQQQQSDLKQKQLRSKGLTLEVGATVRVLSGPFVEFTGIVSELLPKVNKIKALVTVFGNETPIVLDKEAVVVEATPVGQ